MPPDANKWQGKRKNNPAFKEAVGRLFGRSDGLIVRAVDDFLAKNPGSLDHQSLRLVAAAAPHFKDPNHVALMIDNLSISEMDVGLAPLDLAEASESLGHVITKFSERNSRNLVLDLIRTSALDVLQNSPADRVPEAGRTLVVDHLVKQTKRGAREVEKALNSPFVDNRIVSAALDQLEREVRRRNILWNDEKLIVSDCLAKLLSDDLSRFTTDEQLDRAWRGFSDVLPLIWDLPPDNSYSDRVIARHARSIIELLEANHPLPADISPQLTLLLGSTALPDKLIPRIVAQADYRYVTKNARLTYWRMQQHEKGNDASRPPSSQDLDVELSSGALGHAALWASEIEDPRALEVLSRRTGEMDAEGRAALLGNPKFDSSYLATMLEDIPERPDAADVWTGPFGSILRADFSQLLISPKLDDEQVAQLMKKLMGVSVDVEQQCLIVAAAACNPSSGPAVFEQFESTIERFERDHSLTIGRRIAVLSEVARTTPSAYIQAAMIPRAVAYHEDYRESTLVFSLLHNGTLRTPVHDRLRELIPDEVPMDIDAQLSPRVGAAQLQGRPAHYRLEDVAELIANGDTPGSRADLLLRQVHSSHGYEERGTAAIRRLIDSELLPDQTSVEMARDVDPHFALLFATHPGRAGDVSQYVTTGPKRLEQTGRVLGEGTASIEGNSREITSWDRLPREPDVMIPRGPWHALLDGREVGGFKLSMPRTHRDVEQLADEMGNCIAAYTGNIVEGSVVLGYVRDKREIYAAMWQVDNDVDTEGEVPQLLLREVNSKFNQRQVPDEFKDAVEKLTEKLNRQELEPVEKPQQEERRIRPPRRRAVPDLTPVARHDEPTVEAAPSLLAHSADEPTTDPTVSRETGEVAEPGVNNPDPDTGIELV